MSSPRAFGKYRLLEPIASGGMAEVWRAEVPGAAGFVKPVALKLIRGDHDARGEFVQMFIREARLASRLAHGNIVQVFDFDQVEGRYYIAMELVRGRTLRQVVDRSRELGLRFGLARAVHVCAEIARALAYAHRVEDGAVAGGVVHRDVSPQNVLLSFEGEVKLTDFGIARALQSGEVTSPGTVKGKLAYMAPEQARGLPVDARADVFSVGVILWELCTGRRLFARDSDAAMLAAVVAPEAISPPSQWNEAVPPELDGIVLGALARDASQRTPTADALASTLASLRLRLATSHEDLDLRTMLCRLWPDGDAPPRNEGAPEPTALRSTREAAPAHPSATADEADRPPPEALALHTDDAPTRTAVGATPGGSPRPLRRAWMAMAAGLTLALVTASAWRWFGPSTAGTAPRASVSAPRAPTILDPSGDGAADAAPTASSRPASDRLPLASPPRPVSPLAQRDGVRGQAPSAAVRGHAAAAAGSMPPARARATIVVHATPWAYVTIDGAEAGDTPVDATVAPAEHRVHAHHPTLGDDEAVVKLAPGERYVWRPKLSR